MHPTSQADAVVCSLAGQVPNTAAAGRCLLLLFFLRRELPIAVLQSAADILDLPLLRRHGLPSHLAVRRLRAAASGIDWVHTPYSKLHAPHVTGTAHNGTVTFPVIWGPSYITISGCMGGRSLLYNRHRLAPARRHMRAVVTRWNTRQKLCR